MAVNVRIAILGSGPGGYVAAIKAAQLGADVTLIESGEVGGTCLNVGCIPTKALLASVSVLRRVKSAAEFGVMVGEPTVDFGVMADRKDRVVRQLVQGVEHLLKKNKVSLVKGEGWLVEPGRLHVEGEEEETDVEADRVIVATGSVPVCPPGFPMDETTVLTSSGMLALRERPESLLVVGAGYIGLEFACVYAPLGTKVTVVEMLPQVLPGVDRELAGVLEREVKKQGVVIHTGCRVEELTAGPDGGSARLDSGETVRGERVLVAVGRRPNIEGIGLEEVGVATKDGHIDVNSRMETSVPGVYAIGDVTGGALLAHKASREAAVAVENCLGQECEMSYAAVPGCIYTEPEVATAGLTEEAAKEKGLQVRVGRFPFAASGKARALGHTEGLVKIVVEESSRRVVGMHLVGDHVTELIAGGCLAIERGVTAGELSRVMHPHPTLSEAIMEAAEAAEGAAVHI